MFETQPQFHSVAEAVRAVGEAIGDSDFERAAAMASAALGEGLIHPALHNAIALWLQRQGQEEEALASFQRARALAPKDVVILNAVGVSLLRLDRLDEALATFESAIALQPAYAQSHQRKGMVLDRQGRALEAQQAYKRAVSLQPDNVDAVASLASARARAGDTAKAAGYAERALNLDPENATALTALALLDLARRDFVSAEVRLRALTRQPAVSDQPHAVALGLLGDALHGQHRARDAFDAWEASNEESRRLNASRFPPGTGIAALTDQILDNFELFARSSRQVADEPDPFSPDVAGHVFLLGFHRSGTTLLEQILKRHELVETIEERELLAESVNRYLTTRAGMERLAALSTDERALARQQYWKRVNETRPSPSGKVLIDKHPLNTMKLPLILTLFPNAKILFVIRDPRDVILSCFRGHFVINAAMYEYLTLAGSARLYDRVMQLGEICRKRAPEAFLDCRYEELIEDFDGVTRTICDFLDIPWHEGLRDFATAAQTTEIRSPSAAQVRRGIYSDSIGLWRRYADELAPVMPVLRPWIERFGYPLALRLQGRVTLPSAP